jgi:hypothetical protein
MSTRHFPSLRRALAGARPHRMARRTRSLGLQRDGAQGGSSGAGAIQGVALCRGSLQHHGHRTRGRLGTRPGPASGARSRVLAAPRESRALARRHGAGTQQNADGGGRPRRSEYGGRSGNSAAPGENQTRNRQDCNQEQKCSWIFMQLHRAPVLMCSIERAHLMILISPIQHAGKAETYYVTTITDQRN